MSIKVLMKRAEENNLHEQTILLGTQCKGYMTSDIFIALMSVRRYTYEYFDWEDETSFSLDNLNHLINESNKDGILTYTVPQFPDPPNRHYGIAAPKLMTIVREYDLSPETILDEEWLQIIAFISGKQK